MVAENYDRSGREVQRKAGLDRKALIRKISRPGQEARLKRDFVDASNCACALLWVLGIPYLLELLVPSRLLPLGPLPCLRRQLQPLPTAPSV